MRVLARRRVAVTGLGVVSDIGLDTPSFWDSLLAGRSGIGPITRFPQDDQWIVRIAGEVKGFDPEAVIDPREAKRMDRFTHFGVAAAREAVRDSGIDFSAGDPYRRGVAIGSGVGGIETIEIGHLKLIETGPRKVNPFTVPKLMVNACAGHVSILHNLKGANIVSATACASGSHAIGTAFHLIERGAADVMVAGGAEAAVTTLCISSFSTMRALSARNDAPTKASRPFDRDRDGFVLAEGGAILVLEEMEQAKARGARIYAEVLGYGSSGDAGHIAAPDAEGAGARASMAAAIADAGLNASDIGYINAHGTSTPLGDAAEVAAVRSLFGPAPKGLSMSSTKGHTGHMLGAAGGIESVATILALHKGVLPPTLNLDHPDEGFDLDLVPNQPRERRVDHAINNSFGFGGHNTSIVFGRFRD